MLCKIYGLFTVMLSQPGSGLTQIDSASTRFQILRILQKLLNKNNTKMPEKPFLNKLKEKFTRYLPPVSREQNNLCHF